MAKIITVLCILLIILPIAILALLSSELIILAILIVPILVTYMYSPSKVILEDDRIVIERVLGEVEIFYADIREVSLISKPKMLRIFGSGGLFGCFGMFRLNGETVHVYARRMRDFVMIKADKTHLIAPENPEDFMRNLKHVTVE